MQEESKFSSFRLTTTLTSTLFLLWYFLNYDLKKVPFFKAYGLDTIEYTVYLPILLLILNLYFMFETYLEFNKISNKTKESKFQFIIALSLFLISTLIIYPKIIESTIIEETTRLHLLTPIISGFLIYTFINSSIFFIYGIKAFKKIIGIIFFFIFTICILLILTYFTIKTFINFSSNIELYNYSILLTSIFLTYLYNYKSKEKRNEIYSIMETWAKHKYRNIEIDYLNSDEEIIEDNLANEGKTIKHKDVMKSIQKSESKQIKEKIELLKDGIRNKEIELIYKDENKIEYKNEKIPNEKLEDLVQGINVSQFTVNGEKLNIKELDADKKNDLLMQSANLGNHKEIKNLINSGLINIDYQADNGYTPLLIATANGHYKTVKLLLEKAASTEIKNHYGVTPLLFAVKYNKRSLCKLLLEYGANVNVKDNYGDTPLIIASDMGFITIVEVLLENQADINAVSVSGMTAFDYAKKNHHGGICKTLKALQKTN